MRVYFELLLPLSNQLWFQGHDRSLDYSVIWRLIKVHQL